LHSSISHVLRGARVAGEPVALRTRVQPGARGSEPLCYTETQLQQACAEARASGFAAGASEGAAQATERLADLAHAFEAAAAGLAKQRANLLHQTRGELGELVLAMAERLARRALELDTGAFERALTDVLDAAGRTRPLSVRLHPDDAERLRALPAQDPLRLDAERFELRADPSIGAGGCVVDTPEMRYDATLESHLVRFAEALVDWRDQETLVAPLERLRPEGLGALPAHTPALTQEVLDAA
jgi:flagellar assembly protein FliH